MVPDTVAKAGPYVAGGEAGRQFPVPFALLDPGHLAVWVDGAQVADTAFTVTVSPGGNYFTFNAGSVPAAGSVVAAVRDVPLSQETDIPNNTAFLPEVVETALDKLTMITQQLAEADGRCVKMPPTSDEDPEEFVSKILAAAENARTAETAATAAAASQSAAAGSAQSAAGSAQSAATAATAAVATHDSSAAAHQDIRDAITGAQVPTGTVVSYAAPGAIPAGFLLCDGSTVSRTIYSGLFAVIGTAYGEGDGSTTFKLPDFRGAFLRGYKSELTAEIGTIQPEGLPNIHGGFPNRDPVVSGWAPDADNAFYTNSPDHLPTTIYGGTSYDINAGVSFDARRCSLIYGNSTHVTPLNSAIQFLIKY